MVTKKIDLWAHSEDDAKILRKAVHKAFGNEVEISAKAMCWRNTGDRQEDTRVGYDSKYKGNPDSTRFVRTLNVEVADAAEFRDKLQYVLGLFPDSFFRGNAISIGPIKLSVIDGGIDEEIDYPEPTMASAG